MAKKDTALFTIENKMKIELGLMNLLISSQNIKDIQVLHDLLIFLQGVTLKELVQWKAQKFLSVNMKNS